MSESYDLEETEDTECAHMLTGADRLETNEGDLHTRKSPNSVPGRVPYVEAVREPAHEYEDESVQGYHVRNKHVSTPSCDHVEIKYCSDGTEQCAPLLQGFNPAEEGEHEEEDGNGFVIVGTCDRTRNIAWYDSNKGCRKKTCTFILHFLCKPLKGVREARANLATETHIYVAHAVNALNPGARSTHTFLISTGRLRACSKL